MQWTRGLSPTSPPPPPSTLVHSHPSSISHYIVCPALIALSLSFWCQTPTRAREHAEPAVNIDGKAEKAKLVEEWCRHTNTQSNCQAQTTRKGKESASKSKDGQSIERWTQIKAHCTALLFAFAFALVFQSVFVFFFYPLQRLMMASSGLRLRGNCSRITWHLEQLRLEKRIAANPFRNRENEWITIYSQSYRRCQLILFLSK